MKLTTRLLILVAVVMLVSITASLLLFSANRQLTEALNTSETIDQTVEGIVQLSILTSDYLISPSDRASSQWLSKQNSIVESLTLITVNDTEKQGLLQDALQELETAQATFTQLVENKQQSNSTESELKQELDERLTGQISVELQRLLNISNSLKALNKADLDSAQRTSNLVGITLLVLLFAIILAFYITTNVSILRPVFSLTQIAEDISQGKLTVEFPETENQNEIGVLSRTFRQMTNQLQETLASLEQRVADRTRNLVLAADVGRAVSQVHDLDVMLKDACELILKEFNLYYVQVYLTDTDQTKLILEAGTGEVGAKLIGLGHNLPFDANSINGRAAVDKRTVLITDTSKSGAFRKNPLLPETRGEMAVPLIVAETVVGVLDMQSNKPSILTEEVRPAFEALAGQLAVAVQNANLLTQAENSAQEARSLVDNAPEAIVVVDLTTGLFTDPNQNAEKLYGLLHDELLKVGPAHMSPPTQPDGRDSTEKAMEKIGEAMQGGLPVFDWTHRNAQGQDIQCEVRLVKLPGDKPRVRASVTDITERKQFQDLTAQRARQQEAINTITQRIQAATSIEEAMQVAARELGHALGQRQTAVTLEPSVLGGNGNAKINE